MADYEKTHTIAIPDVGIADLAELGIDTIQIAIPDVGIVDSAIMTEAKDVDKALLYNNTPPGYTDYTTEAQSAGGNDVPLFAVSVIGSGFYVGSTIPFDWIMIDIGTAGTGTYTVVYKYYNGVTWENVTEVYDSTNDLKTAGYGRVHFVRPDDWQSVSVDGSNLYWIFISYVSGTVTMSPVADQIMVQQSETLYEKSFSDSISMTDFSAASGFVFGKNVSDLVTVDDSGVGAFIISGLYAKVLSDNLVIIDGSPGSGTFVLGFNKNLSDNVSIDDSGGKFVALLNLGLILADTLVIYDGTPGSDTFVFDFAKVLADNLNITELFVKSISMPFADSVPMDDSWYEYLLPEQKKFDTLIIRDYIYKEHEIAEGDTLTSIVAVLADNSSNRPWMPYMAIGTSNIAVRENETQLWEEVHRKLADVKVKKNTYFIRATFGQDEPTQDGLTLYEVGIFNAASGGDMGRRWVLDTGISKDNIDEIVIECALTFLQYTILYWDLYFDLDAGADSTEEDQEIHYPSDVCSISDTISLVLG